MKWNIQNLPSALNQIWNDEDNQDVTDTSVNIEVCLKKTLQNGYIFSFFIIFLVIF